MIMLACVLLSTILRILGRLSPRSIIGTQLQLTTGASFPSTYGNNATDCTPHLQLAALTRGVYGFDYHACFC
jgi:hypothetical protein